MSGSSEQKVCLYFRLVRMSHLFLNFYLAFRIQLETLSLIRFIPSMKR